MSTEQDPGTEPDSTEAVGDAWRISRRGVMKTSAALATVSVPVLGGAQPAPQTASPMSAVEHPAPVAEAATSMMRVVLHVNGQQRLATVDTRTTLLDVLRENLALKGTKKGCDHGQCGACTVLIDGRRTNACLTLAVMHDGQEITTIEGLSRGEQLHPMQAAFLKHDGFQCGYCTPGQICSSVGMLAEVRMGMPSHATRNLAISQAALTDEEIRERMSGNLCRCSAYPNIVAAIREVAGQRL